MFDRFEWFERTWEHCPPGDEPLIVRARAAGSDCWLFLARSAPGRAVGLASWYTLAFRPVFTGDPDDKTKRALLVASARRLGYRRTAVASLHLEHVPQAEADLIADAFPRARWLVSKAATSINWTVNVSGKSFADYWAERPGQLRSTVKRRGAKANAVLSVIDHFDDDAWAAYEAIYAASWKPDEGSMPFLRAMAEAEGAAGALRMGVAHIEGDPVAAQLWTVDHGRAIIHKLAHLESAIAFSPGSLLSAAMFEHVIDRDHVDVVDFGTGDDAYKADWMDMRAPLYALTLHNLKTARGIGGAVMAGLRRLVRGGSTS